MTVPDNGGVVPSSCSKTYVEYGTRCVFHCNDGFELSGPRYTTCQDDTSWSEIAPLSCVKGEFRNGQIREVEIRTSPDMETNKNRPGTKVLGLSLARLVAHYYPLLELTSVSIA